MFQSFSQLLPHQNNNQKYRIFFRYESVINRLINVNIHQDEHVDDHSAILILLLYSFCFKWHPKKIIYALAKNSHDSHQEVNRRKYDSNESKKKRNRNRNNTKQPYVEMKTQMNFIPWNLWYSDFKLIIVLCLMFQIRNQHLRCFTWVDKARVS